jgi:hypothetical protein
MSHFSSTSIAHGLYYNESVFEVEQLGAKRLVDLTSNLFRPRRDGTPESTKCLETLVCTNSAFDTSDPRDTVYAFRNIAKEFSRPDGLPAKLLPAPDYSLDLFEVYRGFIRYAIEKSRSLDILCRQWALKERKTKTPTTPRLVNLPSYIQFVEDSAWGMGEDQFNGRRAGDPFVGPPDSHIYYASGKGAAYKPPKVSFAHGAVSASAPYHDMALSVRGVVIGNVSFRTDPFPDGVIPEHCLRKLGWSFNGKAKEVAEVPSHLWQTLVADRGPDGKETPSWYAAACQYCLRHQTRNGHLNISNLLRQRITSACEQRTVQDFLNRVLAVTWDRSFIEGIPGDVNNLEHPNTLLDKLVGFGPPNTEIGDVIAILYGCSVPVILRPTTLVEGAAKTFQLVGEAYIYGEMDGEVFEEHYMEQDFRLI